MNRRRLAFCAAAVLAAGGCTKHADDTKPAPPLDTKAAPPVALAKDTKPAGQLTDPACMGRWTEEGEAKKLEIGGRSFQLKGAALSLAAPDEDDQAVIGLVADIKENTPENLANLDAILKFFKEQKAEAIVVDGDLGDDQKQIEAALDKLAESGLPVLAVIGNREGRAAFNDAVTSASGRHNNVINFNHVRLVNLDDVALLSVPGYHNKVYIHADDGCLYTAADLQASKPALAAAKGKPVVVVSHGPPKQDGADALDRTLEQVNVGDPALADFLKDNGIKFGVFANIHEAGGRATNLAGSSLISEGKPSDELYISIGPADSVRWTMNDGTESIGMASLLTVKGDKATFKVFRIRKKPS